MNEAGDFASRVAELERKLAETRERKKAASADAEMFANLDDEAAAQEALELFDSLANIEDGILHRLVKITGQPRDSATRR